MSTNEAYIQTLIEYHFKDNKILTEALTPSEYRRLGFLGDKVVGLMIAEHNYQSKASCETGSLQLGQYASNKEMAQQARAAKLDECIRADMARPRRVKNCTHLLGTEVEAIIGAVWVDSKRDFGAVERAMRVLNIYPC